MNNEEILRKYKLTDFEHDKIYEEIKNIYIDGKQPQEHPITVIAGGQPGSGKSGLLGYSSKMFPDNNVIILNSDEIKQFHPKNSEIARLHPDLYTPITGQESDSWTSRLFEDLRKLNYNIIFEIPMKNTRIVDGSIKELEALGYTVIIRVLATCDVESRISILERYEGQIQSCGWGRLVVPELHNAAYEGMPKTIDFIEQNGFYDILEVYTRGEDPTEPHLVYSQHNKSQKEKISAALEDKVKVSKIPNSFGYANAYDAIMSKRQEEYSTVIPRSKERLRGILDSMKERNASSIELEMTMDVFKLIEEKIERDPSLCQRNQDIEDMER